MPEGATALYAASGTGQMFYHNDAGSYVVAVNNPKYDNSGGGASGGGGSASGANVSFRAAGGSSQQQTERYASLRHVNKKPQDRSGSSSSNGGGSAGASARDTSGGGSSGQSQPYQHEGESINTEVRCTSSRIEFRVGGNVVGYYDTQGSKWSFTGEMHLGQDSANHPAYGVNGGVGMTTLTSGVGAVLVNATKPGPPTSEDNMPLSELESKLMRRINELETRLARLER
jgi:hypothetical protein